MHHLIKKGLLAMCLTGMMSSAMATTSLDLKVQGKIMPPSCTPSFGSGGGVVDFGTIKLSSLSLVNDTVLPTRTVSVIITCQEAARFGLTFTDQRKGSVKTVSGNYPYSEMQPVFGLGFGADQEKIGAYAVAIDGDTVKNSDNAARKVITNTGGTTWKMPATKWVPLNGLTNTVYSFTMMADDVYSPSAETKMSFDLHIDPVISDLTNLKVKDEIDLDGLTFISLVYL